MHLMQRENALLLANRERAAFLASALERHAARRITDEEQRRLYELNLRGKDSPLGPAAYGAPDGRRRMAHRPPRTAAGA